MIEEGDFNFYEPQYRVGKENRDFYLDVIRGLAQVPKRLPSKYFYDKNGDRLFQEIMASPDYYLTRCEMEIFTCQAKEIIDSLSAGDLDFELIELGPGNCAKSIHLLRALVAANASFNYVPIDISENVISGLQSFLPGNVPELRFKGLAGDYFDTLAFHCLLPATRRVVMCLGANIGNMTVAESNQFCKQLRGYLQPGDQCIIGFDLVKHPAVIRRAYDDRAGVTREFNLNLLKRINRELEADFRIDRFDHYCSYDPLTGAARSYLVCLSDMVVNIAGTDIPFQKDECIWTEISQKYSKDQIRQMATNSGFIHTSEFLDSRSWFMDAVWTAV
ncbi:L-histidine N(alpha)-methyltransferase [Chitinophaga sp. GCM10012297]|uniref:L-histidine N(Alpha)-methyltransferase n=1 Tax=Chitinophaga chungangae TaxID=2821488 RepID=A0ABS3YFR1_9BACT|nr:L-histidine N(alpha)-methyltransferase [Chitinophaga chungangae]MBO9153513.1 L-histidine N(alpha)-methyltransferase [Chitinophaga chungangae]